MYVTVCLFVQTVHHITPYEVMQLLIQILQYDESR